MSAAEPITTSTEPVAEETSVATANWRDSLPVDIRDNATLGSLDSVEALAKEHINVQKLIGADKIALPKEDWNDDQRGELYQKLGRPAKAEDYDLEGLERNENLPWDSDFETEMLGVMHAAGLNSVQAKKILGGYIASVGSQYEQSVGDTNRGREEGIQDLRNEWGKSFDAQVDLAKRAFSSGAGENFQELADIELSDGGKLGDHPAIIKAFAVLGGKMNEHGLVGGKTTNATMTPEGATSERNKLLSDEKFMEAYLNESHLEHASAVKRISDLTVAQLGG